MEMHPGVPVPGPAVLSARAGLDEWLEQAKQCKYLPEADMVRLCEIVKELLIEESNIQPVTAPVTVCGDIHGQFYDLLELFRVAGGIPDDSSMPEPAGIDSKEIEPPSTITDPSARRKMKRRYQRDSRYTGSVDSSSLSEDEVRGRSRSSHVKRNSSMDTGYSSDEEPVYNTVPPEAASRKKNFIFLGDFVDRGYFSLETFTLLMCLKAKYPDRVTLVRGNHESRQITQVYGFYDECQQKYGTLTVWKNCCQVFDFLALAAIINGKILCVHGGLSPEIRTLDQIRVVARAQEIPHEGAFCDLVWSDPEDVDQWSKSPRGAGWLFGEKIALEFNHVNSLDLIARAHQLVQEGYKHHFPSKEVVTVWSAPNYCYRCGNVASIMHVNAELEPDFTIFSAVPNDRRAVPKNQPSRREYFI